MMTSMKYRSFFAALVIGVVLVSGACNLADPFGSGSGGNARLILGLGSQARGFSMPRLDPADVTRYEILLKDGGGTPSTIGRTNADLANPIDLSPGSWTVELKAYDASDRQIGTSLDSQSGLASLTVVLAAGDNPVDVPLVPFLARTASGTGNAVLDFVWQAPSPVTAVAVTMLTFINGVLGTETGLSSPDLVFDAASQTLHLAMNGLASGDYIVKMTGSNSSGAYNTVSHMIKVYDNLITRGTITISKAMLTAAPPAPLSLEISGMTKSPDSLELSWTWDQNTGFYPLGYRIYINGSLAGTASGESTTTYTCSGEGSLAATFEVRSYNAAGESAAGGALINYVPLVSAIPEATSFSLAANTTKSLGITYTPANANPKTISWTSTDYSVAYVSGSPNPTIWAGASSGTVTITGTGLDGAALVTLTVTIQPDLLGLWDFEAGDNTNGANLASVTMAAATPDTADAFQSVYSLALAGSGLDISDSSPGSVYSGWNGAWTVMAWVKPDGAHAASDPDQAIFNKQILHVDDGLWLQHDNGPTEIWLFYNGTYTSFNAMIPNDEWSHLALVNTGSAIQLHVDGVLQATQITDTAVVQGMSIPMGKVGASTTAGCGFWGRMDNIEFYSRLVDASQIASRVQKGFASGKGTLAHPYEINTQADLLTMSGSPNTWFRQMSDIVLDSGFYNRFNGYTADNQFRGTYDGTGKTITGLNLQENWWDVGLFGTTENATIRNVNLTGTITRTGNVSSGNTGLLVGKAIHTRIENTRVTGTVTNDGTALGTVNLGGMAGRLDGGAILDSTARVDVSGGFVAGGLVGYVYTNTQTYEAAGGAVISNSASIGTVSSTEALNVVGGLIGRVYNGTTSALADKAVIKSSYHQGNVTADYMAGGLIGLVTNNVVSGSYGVSIIDSYARSINLTTFKSGSPVYQGGLVGYFINNGADGGTIQNSWAVANLVHTATGYANAFIGLVAGTAVNLSGNFFDSDVSPTDPLVTGVNTAGMTSLAGFTAAGWSIGTAGLETWRITDGASYPWLSWQVLDYPLAP